MKDVHPRAQRGGALSGTKKVTRLDNRHHVTSDNVHEKCGDVSGDSHVIEQSEEEGRLVTLGLSLRDRTSFIP